MGPEVTVVRALINRTHVFYELLGRLYCVALRQVPIVQCSNLWQRPSLENAPACRFLTGR